MADDVLVVNKEKGVNVPVEFTSAQEVKVTNSNFGAEVVAQQWEYIVEQIPSNIRADEMTVLLNRKGSAKFELVSNFGGFLIYKRPL